MIDSRPVVVSSDPFQPQSKFVGRELEIKKYLSVLEKGQTKLIGIHGMGGVGKTALALKLVERLSREIWDTYIYIDMWTVSSKRTSLPNLVLPIISYFRTDTIIPHNKDEILAAYRSVLFRKRGIIVIDNVDTPKQVLPLLPFSNHIVIVVSRQNFALPNLYSRTLDVLTPPEARELIIKMAPNLNDVADELARICEYLPLALKLATDSYKRRADISPYDFINQMSISSQNIRTKTVHSRFDKDMLATIWTSINISYKLLSQELKRFWCMLSVLPGDFNKSSAQAVWNLDPDSTQLLLSKLVSRNMLAWTPDRSVYHLHRFLRLYASIRLRDHK